MRIRRSILPVKTKEGKLIGSSEKTATRSIRWGGGFNPFATYDLAISACKGRDSTGPMIQKFGDTRYALYGSADRTVCIATYPDPKPEGELDIYLPPWNEGNGTHIWLNVIPLPEDYPALYLALMMDRVNFPGTPKPNWTYGALYLHHGWPNA